MNVFELRIYEPEIGRLDAVVERFRRHTNHIFPRHGIHALGYWIGSDARLYYIVRHDGPDPDRNWAAFRSDPDWLAAKHESEADGPIVRNIESTYLTPTGFSALT